MSEQIIGHNEGIENVVVEDLNKPPYLHDFNSSSKELNYALTPPLRTQIIEKLGTYQLPPSIDTFLQEKYEEQPDQYSLFSSNEPYLYKTFPYTQELVKEGANLGVGIDQMLNFHINSSAQETHIIDITRPVHISTRVALEVGYRFKQLFGRIPTCTEFIELFNPQTISSTLQLLTINKFSGYQFSKEEFAIARSNLVSEDGRASTFYRYLSYESDIKRKSHNNWVSKGENLAKVIDDYEQQKIRLYWGSLSGNVVMPSIAEDLRTRGVPLSFFYFSNIDCQSDIIGNFLISPDMIVIFTKLSNSPNFSRDPDFAELRGSKSWDYFMERVSFWSKNTINATPATNISYMPIGDKGTKLTICT